MKPYRSSKSRITNQQESYNLLTDQIISFVNDVTVAEDAETIWLRMREKGSTMSHTTFNNRLKKLVEDGLVEKISLGYNKNYYRSATPKI